ncbi:uncharacterized protein TA09895 [Theileria annulata]|uniref:Sugar phosphate transporter domain-containing protein n=1 Tax=Theileria annulata TaxID=5874 RepID=Q4U8P2_THEAN|nr:uncharacterized protein TA09895 [Theileria annulata]CAI76811.1 hypothetical protein, conserved [Theileria annulata]|eukprot:XP_953436.1 hypothetical protein, conserved [Theileria annulata]
MSENNFEQFSDSYLLDVDKTFVGNEQLMEGLFQRKEVSGSFDNSKLPHPIEALTTTDSSTSPVQKLVTTTPSTPANADEQLKDKLNLVEDSDFLLVNHPTDILKPETSLYGSTSLSVKSLFGNLSLPLLFYMFIFVLTNTAQPLLILLLRKNGGTPVLRIITHFFAEWNLHISLSNISGDGLRRNISNKKVNLVGLVIFHKQFSQEKWRYPIILSLMDIIHQVVEKAGLVYCGPSIYSIASSTNTLFLALFSKLILKQTVTSLTWLSISLISFSLALSGYVHTEYITSLHILGFFLVMLASMVVTHLPQSALNSIIGEILLKKDTIEGPNLVCMMGLTSLTIFTIWTMVWTVPQRKTLFATDKEINPFDLQNVLKILGILFLSNFGRSSVYYYIIKKSGSVCCGVLKALRIVLVVFADHFLFSYIDGSQKITPGKVVAALIVSPH